MKKILIWAKYRYRNLIVKPYRIIFFGCAYCNGTGFFWAGDPCGFLPCDCEKYGTVSKPYKKPEPLYTPDELLEIIKENK